MVVHAAVVTRFGDSGVFELIELPDPVPGPGQVAIDVSHAAVGLIDVYIRQGRYRTDTVIGPVLDRDQYDRIQHYIKTGINEGGQVLVGGLGHPDGLDDGNYVKPTLLTATNDHTIAREEIFGPVLAVITYRDENDAIAIANDTPYGLHAYIATSDPQRGQHVARRIQAGRIMINEIVDAPDAPFGGFKQSGLGREFGRYGLEAFLETQTIFTS